MAWYTKWRLAFRSILDESYEIDIMTTTYVAENDIVNLTGTDNPFETQEDDSDDVFKPIRGQTGKINIVTNDQTLLPSIMPTSDIEKRVEVKKNNRLVWRGYISSQAYSQPLDSSYVKITIPVKSVLSTLDAVEFTGYYGKTMDVGDAIKNLFQLAGITLNTDASMYFQTELYDTTDYLHSIICTTVFYNLSTYISGTERFQYAEPMNCYEVLSALMRPFGLCVREYHGNFYVVSNVKKYDSDSVIHANRYNFTSKTFDEIDTRGRNSISSLNPFIASDNAKISFNKGAKEVTVKLTVNTSALIDTGDPETPYSTNNLYGGTIIKDEKAAGVTFMQPINYPSVQRRKMWNETLYMKWQSFTRRKATGQTNYNTSSATLENLANGSAFRIDMKTEESDDNPEIYTIGGVTGCCLCRHDEAQKREDMNLSPGLLVNSLNTWAKAKYYNASGWDYDNDTCYSLMSSDSYSFSGGYLHFQLEYKAIEYYKRGYIEDAHDPHIIIRIGSTELIKNTKGSYTIPENSSGPIIIKIRSGWDYGTGNYNGTPITYVITKLRLYWSMREEDITASQESENNYQELIERNFSESKSIELIIGTDNHNRESVSMLYNSNMSLKTTYNIYDGSPLHYLRPEEYLTKLMKLQYTDIQRVFTRTYRDAYLPTSPSFPYQGSSISENYMAIVSKHKWIDNEVTLKFIQARNVS